MEVSKLKEIVDIFKSGELSRLKLEEESYSLTLEKDSAPTKVEQLKPAEVESTKESEILADAMEESQKSSAEVILSPMVGTFYQASSPTSAAFAKPGDVVRCGQPIAIIEAMKIMNEIEAEFDCKIVAVLVEDGQPIEFNTPLFEIERV